MLVLSTVLLGGNDKSLTDGSTRRSLAPVGGGCTHTMRAVPWWHMSTEAQYCSAEDYPVLFVERHCHYGIQSTTSFSPWAGDCRKGLCFNSSSTGVGLVQTSGIPGGRRRLQKCRRGWTHLAKQRYHNTHKPASCQRVLSPFPLKLSNARRAEQSKWVCVL